MAIVHAKSQKPIYFYSLSFPSKHQHKTKLKEQKWEWLTHRITLHSLLPLSDPWLHSLSQSTLFPLYFPLTLLVLDTHCSLITSQLSPIHHNLSSMALRSLILHPCQSHLLLLLQWRVPFLPRYINLQYKIVVPMPMPQQVIL